MWYFDVILNNVVNDFVTFIVIGLWIILYTNKKVYFDIIEYDF